MSASRQRTRCYSDGRVVIAVIDNGFDLDSPVFEHQVVGAYECGPSQATVPPAPASQPYAANCAAHGVHSGPGWMHNVYHGSRIASIAAGEGPPNTVYTGFHGVAPRAQLLLIRRVDTTFDWRYTAAAIRFAVDMGADVVNISFGRAAYVSTVDCGTGAPVLSDAGTPLDWNVDVPDRNIVGGVIVAPQDSVFAGTYCAGPMHSYYDTDLPMVAQSLRYALDNGVPVTCAAGNTASPRSRMMYPATSDYCIGVGKADIAAGTLPTERRYQDHSRNAEGPEKDFVAAPGWSLQAEGGNGSVTPCAGTSCGTPAIAGAVALLLANGAERPQPTDIDAAATHVYALLRASARDIGVPGRDPEFGWGLPDLARVFNLPAPSMVDVDPCTIAALHVSCNGASPKSNSPSTIADLHCAPIDVMIDAGARIDLLRRACAPVGSAWTGSAPSLGVLRGHVYEAPMRIGHTSTTVRGNGWDQLIRIATTRHMPRMLSRTNTCHRKSVRTAISCLVRVRVDRVVPSRHLSVQFEQSRGAAHWRRTLRCVNRRTASVIVCRATLTARNAYRVRLVVRAAPATRAVHALWMLHRPLSVAR